MKKVTTPTAKEVQATTAVVIVTVFLFGAYFWFVDGPQFSHCMDKLLRYFFAPGLGDKPVMSQCGAQGGTSLWTKKTEQI